MRNSILTIAMLLSLGGLAVAQHTTLNQVPIKPTSWASGQQMYQEYCAACHGVDADGQGPAASACTRKPADLKTLARRNRGKFPYDHFYAILQFGTLTSAPAHGSADMPIWLPMFASLNRGHEDIALQRMHNIASYLASLQSK
jgi:mono/diheme cytochrome c family protein